MVLDGEFRVTLGIVPELGRPRNTLFVGGSGRGSWAGQIGGPYSIAIVTVFEAIPAIVKTSGTASPLGASSGTRTLT